MRAGSAGFTLVELMVVVAIAGLATTIAVLALPDRRGRPTDDAQALAARLAAARDLAIVDGHDIAVTIDAGGYGFVERDAAGWSPVTAPALAPRRWRDGVTAAAGIDGGGRLIFDTTGIATPAHIVLRRDDAEAKVTVTGKGEVVSDAR